MKKQLLILLAFCCAVVLLAAENITLGKADFALVINGENGAWRSLRVNGKTVAEADRTRPPFDLELGGNKRIIRIAPKKDQILFFYGGAIKSAKGDVISITVKAKGKGTLNVGYLAYREKEKNNFSFTEPLQLTDKEQTFTKTIEIKDHPKTGAKTSAIRIAILVKVGSEAEITSFNASMEE